MLGWAGHKFGLDHVYRYVVKKVGRPAWPRPATEEPATAVVELEYYA
jgi:hypothetical protein